MLIKAGGTYNTMKSNALNNIATPLHTAVELENISAIKELLDMGVNVACLNSEGQTPMHICVKKRLQEPLTVKRS